MRKRILIFSVAYLPFIGGAELAVKEISDRNQDFDFDLITLRFDSQLPKLEKIGNINVYRIGWAVKNPDMADLVKFPLFLNKYFFPFLAFFEARKLHKKNNYSMIWAIMAAFAGFAALFFKLAYPRTPFLLTLQEGDPLEEIKKKTGIAFPMFQKIFFKADYIQVISNHLSGFARQLGYEGDLSVIPNAVNIALFSQSPSNEILNECKREIGKKENDIFLITTSRLVKKNGIEDVLRAMPRIDERVKFLVVGSGPLEENLKQISRELGIEKRVVWLGERVPDEIPLYLWASDIFIRPSLSEGLGNSFLEAMAVGLPVIATPVGGIPDFLFDPEENSDRPSTGVFCQPNNPGSIAKKVEMLVNSPSLKNELVLNAKKMVWEKYNWDTSADKMNEIFKKIAK